MIIVPELWVQRKWIIGDLERCRKLHHKLKVVRSQSDICPLNTQRPANHCCPPSATKAVCGFTIAPEELFESCCPEHGTIKIKWSGHLHIFKLMRQSRDARSTWLQTSENLQFYFYLIFPYLSFPQMYNFMLTFQNITCQVIHATYG